LQVLPAKYEAVKGYDQYCPIAHALGVVGERWTLLVVRELAHGRSATPTSRAACPGSARTSSPTG
jgi:DNA-binding HxlR family transcriptional regulator